MNQSKFEVRLTEKEAAHYFSNAAALYVLGCGFGFFAVKAQSPFMTGVCFWFSVFLLCDCFRLARVCSRLDRNENLLLTADETGITHYVSWLEPEHRNWNEIISYRVFKAPNTETIYFQLKSRPEQFLRYAFFSTPKFDLPLGCVPGGKETLVNALYKFPAAKHLVPERSNETAQVAKAA
jgi:hypothetical protein